MSLFVLGLVHCQQPVATRVPSSSPASSSATSVAQVKLVVEYSEITNAFEILDNAAVWMSTKNDAPYADAIGIEHLDGVAAYREVRDRYYAEERSHGEEERAREGSLFGDQKPVDRVAQAFYASTSLEDALKKLRDFMKPADIVAVEHFFAITMPRIRPMLEESAKTFLSIGADLQRKLSSDKAIAYENALLVFYDVKTVPTFHVRYVWWPPIDETSASTRHEYLLLKYNPTKHRDDALLADDIVIHELTHWISTHQSLTQKQELTRAFLKGCDVRDKIPPLFILEEPLAVAHQKLYLSVTSPERLEFSQSWYGDPWVGTFAKLIYPQVKEAHDASGNKDRHLDETLMRRSSRVCAQLRKAADHFR